MGLRISRRRLLTGAAAAAAAAGLAGCDRLSQDPDVLRVLYSEDDLNRIVQGFLTTPSSLAKEFPESMISRDFRANGSTDPDDPEYRRLAAGGFADWRLRVGGLVKTPGEYALADLRALPAQTQVTRHDCVEGWSCIGKWTGVRLGEVLTRAGLTPEARYIVFTCADELERTLDGSGRYYETMDLEEAFHPQTLIAYDMNGAPLTIPHGAPVRIRAERKLGYKMAKYVMQIDAVASFADFGRGRGGFWEDRGYDWWGGI